MIFSFQDFRIQLASKEKFPRLVREFWRFLSLWSQRVVLFLNESKERVIIKGETKQWYFRTRRFRKKGVT